MKRLIWILFILPILVACPGEDSDDSGTLLLSGLLATEAYGACKDPTKADTLGVTVTMNGGTSGELSNRYVPSGATTVTLENVSNSNNRAMYPIFKDRDCNTISSESTNAIAVGGSRIYALPEGTTKVDYTFSGGTVTSYNARSTFN